MQINTTWLMASEWKINHNLILSNTFKLYLFHYLFQCLHSFLINFSFISIPSFFVKILLKNKKLSYQKLNKLKSIKLNISINKNIWTLKLPKTSNRKLQISIDPILPSSESAHLLKKNVYQQTKSQKKTLLIKVKTPIK